MKKHLGLLVLLCSIAAGCASSDTTVTVPEPAPDPVAAEDPGAAEDPAAAEDPTETVATTTTAVLEPVADRLPADPRPGR